MYRSLLLDVVRGEGDPWIISQIYRQQNVNFKTLLWFGSGSKLDLYSATLLIRIGSDPHNLTDWLKFAILIKNFLHVFQICFSHFFKMEIVTVWKGSDPGYKLGTISESRFKCHVFGNTTLLQTWTNEAFQPNIKSRGGHQ